MYAQINASTGEIVATTSVEVTTPMPEGIMQMAVPSELGEVAGAYKYNLATSAFELLPELPIEPSLAEQILAALLAKGVITEADLTV